MESANSEQMMALKDYWNVRCYIVITGASRGIGRALALHLSALVGSGSLFLLSARDEQSLVSVKDAMAANNSNLLICIEKYDYSKPDSEALARMLSNSMVAFDVMPDQFVRAVCFHNAGSLGDIGKRATDLTDVSETTSYFQLNLISVMILNSRFLQLFSNSKRVVVNISSLCSVQPMASMALYCTGKAARDMFFRVLATEEPSIRVLNYAPGPVDTDMLSQLVTESWDPQVAQFKEEGNALKPETTVAKLASILATDSFQSGAHVDYFDDIPQ